MSVHDPDERIQRPPTKRGWQYSLFGLLLLTTIVSISLAVGVYYPRIVLTMLGIGLGQVVALYSVEWLMRRRDGETIRRVTASLWTIVIAVAVVMVIVLTALGIAYWMS